MKKNKPDPEVGRCVKRVRDDQRACLRTAQEHCRATFETDLVGCYGPNVDCPKACIETQRKCRATPQTTQDGCKLACSSDQKVELGRCAEKADLTGCRQAARVRALKCTQKCTADAAPALQACLGDFDDCLTACGKAAARSK